MTHANHLDIAHIEVSSTDIEYHPLKPFIPSGCNVLFLGSFPPQQKRWCMPFYYPNFTNDHWRIEGLIFYNDKNHFVDEEKRCFLIDDIVRFLSEKGIGLYDTATAVRRLNDNASDKFLEIIEETDIKELLTKTPNCRIVATTGEKATATLCNKLAIAAIPHVGEFIDIPEYPGLKLYRLPSSSRAYPMALEKKAEAYKKMFHLASIL